MGISHEEMEARKETVIAKCTCEGCPTWFQCGESIGYCIPSVGKSGCIEDELACICKACPAYKELGLTDWYYCTRGA